MAKDLRPNDLHKHFIVKLIKILIKQSRRSATATAIAIAIFIDVYYTSQDYFAFSVFIVCRLC